MALTRKAPAAAGIFLLVLGILAVLSPAVAGLIPIGPALALAGNDYVLVAVLAVPALAAVVGLVLSRTTTGVSEATPPPVEGTDPASPGRDVDDALGSLPFLRVIDTHRRVHARVRAAAVDAVAEAYRCSRPDARDRIESGKWTDDQAAAAFLADDELDPPGLAGRLATRLRRDDWFRRRVDATVAALERLEGESGMEGESA
ncbi:hypothetical protein OB920_08210 [Halobacteria archaeon HArc-gm2]|nr:hypothetical protein [Halobacteria archaeon HArc-gm2]